MRFLFATAAIAVALFAFASSSRAAEKNDLTVIVMDPLSAPLSCPCVPGSAHRDYEKLGKQLEKALGRPGKGYFSKWLTHALKRKTTAKARSISGKKPRVPKQ